MKKTLTLLVFLCFLSNYAQNERLNEKVNDTIVKDTIHGRVKSGLYIRVGLNLLDSSGERNPFDPITSFNDAAFSNPFDFGLEYRFNRLFAVDLDGSINTWKGGEGVIDGFTIPEFEDQNYYSIDAKFKVFLDEALNIFDKWEWLDLYADVGIGYFDITGDDTSAIVGSNDFTANLGTGFNIWVNEYTSIYADITAKFAFENEFPTTNHYQTSLGLMLKLTKTDSDKDGIKDSQDKCPYVYGTKENYGCPEVEPETIVVEKITNENLDSDGDGVVNEFDRCPDTPGLIMNYGCPEKDLDGDGVSDYSDRCPNIAGNSPDGCPEEDLDDGEDINSCLLTNIYFDYNKYNIKVQYVSILNNNIRVMKDNPNRIYTIVGHADNVGSNSFNMSLSRARAETVYDYLTKNGIPASSLKLEWKGENEPISSNETQQGRALNRRVVITAN